MKRLTAIIIMAALVLPQLVHAAVIDSAVAHHSIAHSDRPATGPHHHGGDGKGDVEDDDSLNSLHSVLHGVSYFTVTTANDVSRLPSPVAKLSSVRASLYVSLATAPPVPPPLS